MKIINHKQIKIILAFCVVLYVGWTVVNQQIDMAHNANRLADYNQKIAIQIDQSEQLNKKKELVSTPEYMEKIARERGGMIMPDETLFVDILAN